jgi:hypothetical protein
VYLPAVRSQTAKLIVALTLTLTLGFHWAFLQSVAWTGMLISWSHTTSFSDALKLTFDGKHPCKLCKFVDEGKKSEKKQEVQTPTAKIECSMPGSNVISFQPVPHVYVANTELVFVSRSLSPPTPPPRELHS